MAIKPLLRNGGEMDYKIRKTLTKRQWKIVIDVINGAIFEVDVQIKNALCSDKKAINCKTYIDLLEDDKAELEEILTELE